MVLLLLTLVGIAIDLMRSPKLRESAERESLQDAVCVLLGLCLRMAFRRGLSSGRAFMRMLRGTAWEDRAALIGRIAAGRASPDALPGLALPEAKQVVDGLGRLVRRAARRAAAARRRAARAMVSFGPCTLSRAVARGAVARRSGAQGCAEVPGAKNRLGDFWVLHAHIVTISQHIAQYGG
ncbi:MAG: hypothetical protein JSR21_08345 [Proteobacteria bacterium]|nr:hypothetical protein [Pseudomonadota bacterium]